MVVNNTSGPAGMPLTREQAGGTGGTYTPPQASSFTMYTPEEARANSIFQLPINASPNDVLLPSDDPTVYTYQMQDGSVYFLPAYSQDVSRETPRGVGEAAQRAYDEYVPSWEEIKAIPQQMYGVADRAVNGGATYGDVLNTAAGMAGAGAPVTIPEDALGMFAGRNSPKADLSALDRAEIMEESNYNRDEIYSHTGWFRGLDGNWKFELPDDQFRLSDPVRERFLSGDVSGVTGPAELVFDNSSLHQAYPDANVKANVALGGVGGYFLRGGQTPDLAAAAGPNLSSIEGVALHELQHAAQEYEGWSRGANVGQVTQMQEDFLAAIPSDLTNYLLYYGTINSPEFKDSLPLDLYNEYQQEFADQTDELIDRIGWDKYNDLVSIGNQLGILSFDTEKSPSDWLGYSRNQGEVEARATESRHRLTQAERDALPPWLSYDVHERDTWDTPTLTRRMQTFINELGQDNASTSN